MTSVMTKDIAKVWAAMRGLKSFTLAELFTITETRNDINFRQWLDALLMAGYVKADGKRDREPLYRVAKNTGPKAPESVEIRLVYDPNTEDYFCENVCSPCCRHKDYRVPGGTRQAVRTLIAAGKTYRAIAKDFRLGLGTVHAIAKEGAGHVD